MIGVLPDEAITAEMLRSTTHRLPAAVPGPRHDVMARARCGSRFYRLRPLYFDDMDGMCILDM